jgi:hypothetical protein
MDDHALETWKRRAEAELAGAALETLRTPLGDGLAIEPLYLAAPYAAHAGTARSTLADATTTPGAAILDTRTSAAPVAELALALDTLVEALPAEPRLVIFKTEVGDDMLLQIAKLRALRRLATRVLELVSDPRPALELHAFARPVPAPDGPTGLIHTSFSVFAAVVGGADRVWPVTPGLDPRLADNTVRIALDEAHLGAVADPAAGSFAFEALTEDLCRAAWSAFRERRAEHRRAGGEA